MSSRRKLRAEALTVLERLELLEGQTPTAIALRERVKELEYQLQVERLMRERAEIDLANLKTGDS